jgi:hypothetical protein
LCIRTFDEELVVCVQTTANTHFYVTSVLIGCFFGIPTNFLWPKHPALLLLYYFVSILAEFVANIVRNYR